MLVLNRKQREAVVVGRPGSVPGTGKVAVLVTVLAIEGRTVKLGFDAPADYPVHRWELWERIRTGALPKAGPAKPGTHVM